MSLLLRTMLTVGLFALSVVVLATVSVPTAAAATTTYSDPAGDVPAGTPDITDVTVSTPNSSEFDFTVMLNSAVYGADFFLDIYLYTTDPSNPRYLIRLDGGQSVITIYDRSTGTAVPFTASLLDGTSSLTPEVIRVGASDIGNPSSFDFQIFAWNYDATASPACCYDSAGTWHFDNSAASATTTSGGSDGSGSTTGSSGSASAPPSGMPPGGLPPAIAPSGSNSGSSSSQGSSTSGADGAGSTGSAGASSPSHGTSWPTAGSGTKQASRLSVRALSRPRAGNSFVLMVAAGAAITSMRCSAFAAGRRITAKATPGWNGTVLCAMKLARASRGRMLRVTLVARTTAGRLTAEYAARIR